MTKTEHWRHADSLRRKYQIISPYLNERARRLWAAAEAKELGHGGVRCTAEATKLSRTTIHEGLKELSDPKATASPDRIRRPGGGTKASTEKDPALVPTLRRIIEPDTRGDPMSPLLWTSKSTANLAEALAKEGHPASPMTVARLLHQEGYSLQGNRKQREGTAHHPDRDAQFRYINENVKKFQKKNQPVISVDAKKKELVGNFKNPGQEWRKKKEPREVNMHDFPDKKLGKVIPYGVYDLSKNEGWVNVGITHDTASFAACSIKRWWDELGKKRYPGAEELLVTAGCGGSNGNRSRLWKFELQTLADETGLTIRVRHFPPGTSKWNKVEHRLFSFITKNWRGKPLIDRATAINLIANTKTQQGLKVYAVLDEKPYETGRKVSNEEMDLLHIIPESFHGEWNYRVEPRE